LKTVASLKVGDSGIIEGYRDEVTATRVMELGGLPGRQVLMLRAAPFNGPCYLKIEGKRYALRRAEAENILISSLGENGNRFNS